MERSLTLSKCFLGITRVCPKAIGYLSRIAMKPSSWKRTCEGVDPFTISQNTQPTKPIPPVTRRKNLLIWEVNDCWRTNLRRRFQTLNQPKYLIRSMRACFLGIKWRYSKRIGREYNVIPTVSREFIYSLSFQYSVTLRARFGWSFTDLCSQKYVEIISFDPFTELW